MGVKPTYQDFADLDLIRSDTLPNKLFTIFIFQASVKGDQFSTACLSPCISKGCGPLQLVDLSEQFVRIVRLELTFPKDGFLDRCVYQLRHIRITHFLHGRSFFNE